MINAYSLYQDVARDTANESENGLFSYEMFNRMSRKAELRLIDWLSGDTEGIKPPEPYLTQKNKDWLSPFIKKHSAQTENGVIQKPDDYYGFDNLYIIGASNQVDCDTQKTTTVEQCNTPIEVLNGQQFNERCKSYIVGIKPSMSSPIAKIVGNTFEFAPKDLGSTQLEYIRYPIFAVIITKFDNQYNEIVPDEAASTNYEWSENSRELLGFFIAQQFSTHTREKSLLEQNQVVGKNVRG